MLKKYQSNIEYATKILSKIVRPANRWSTLSFLLQPLKQRPEVAWVISRWINLSFIDNLFSNNHHISKEISKDVALFQTVSKNLQLSLHCKREQLIGVSTWIPFASIETPIPPILHTLSWKKLD